MAGSIRIFKVRKRNFNVQFLNPGILACLLGMIIHIVCQKYQIVGDILIKLYVPQQRYNVSINVMYAISEKHINMYAFNKIGFKIM